MTQKELDGIWDLSKVYFYATYGSEHESLFKEVKLHTIEDGKCYLHTSENYVYKQILEKKDKIEEIINKVLLIRNMQVEVVIKREIDNNFFPVEVIEEQKEQEEEFINETNLQESFTFSNFVVGENSQFTYYCCLSVMDNIIAKKNPEYNPLLIFGDSGLGKTHLAQAVGNEILKKDPTKNVKYITAEQFNNDFLLAIRRGNLRSNIDTAENFRHIYRNLDLIIIDDIQFFEKVFGKGDGSVEEEFFNTFNALNAKKKQMIFISDRNPKKIKGISDRLKSRFASGISVEIKKPDYSTRVAILQTLCEKKDVKIDDAVLEYIADNVTENVREMEGILNFITTKSRLLNVNINIDLVKNTIEEKIEKERANITASKIASIVAQYYNITEEEMKSQSRKAEIVIGRNVAMYIMRKKIEISLSETGKYFNRDHSTVHNSIDRVIKKMNDEKDFVEEIHNIMKRISE